MHLNPNKYIHVPVQLNVRRRGMESCSAQSRSILRIEQALALSPVVDISNRAPQSNFRFFQLTSPSASSVLRQPPCKPHDSHGPPCHVLAHTTNTPRTTFPTLPK